MDVRLGYLFAAFDQVDFTSLDWNGAKDVIDGKGVEILGLKSNLLSTVTDLMSMQMKLILSSMQKGKPT